MPDTPKTTAQPTSSAATDNESSEAAERLKEATEKLNEAIKKKNEYTGNDVEVTKKLADNVKDLTDKVSNLSIAAISVGDRMHAASAALGSFSDAVSNAAKSVFGSIKEGMDKYMGDIGKTADFTTEKMTAFSLATTAAIGPLKSSFGEIPGLNTFAGQFDRFFDTIANNDGVLSKLLKTLGVNVPASIKPGTDAFMNFAKASVRGIFESADAAVKLEDVYLKAAAASGRLGAVTDHTGRDMLGMNKAVADQRSIISNAEMATHLSTGAVESYYQALVKLPAAFKDRETNEQKAIGNASELTRMIQLSAGVHRDYGEVLSDVGDAIRNYNASMPEAMRFTEQISEIAANTGTEISDVEKALRGAADAFKMFGNEGDGAAAILNEYVQSLRATGLSGAVATDIVSNMTNQVGKLTIAQRSFLSAQSGGPGGLMGAYSIDMKMREGKLEEVFNMTKNQLTKMMGGNLVSTSEAATSQSAAAQMTKQITMLRQGPLGSFARSDQEAEHIIDAFKAGKPIDIKALKSAQSGVEDAIKLGNTYQAQTATGMSRLVADFDAMKASASGGAQNLLQASLTGAKGFQFEGEGEEDFQNMRSATLASMNGAADRTKMPANAKSIMEEALRLVEDIPKYTHAAAAGMGKMTGLTSNTQIGDSTFTDYAKRAAEEKREAQNIKSESVRNERLAEIDRNMETVKTAAALQARKRVNDASRTEPSVIPSFLKPVSNATTAPGSALKPATEITHTGTDTRGTLKPTAGTDHPVKGISDALRPVPRALAYPGAAVSGAAATNAAKGTQATAVRTTTGGVSAAHAGQTELLGRVALTVNVGCPKCGQVFETQEHSVALNPASGLRNPNPDGNHHTEGVV